MFCPNCSKEHKVYGTFQTSLYGEDKVFSSWKCVECDTFISGKYEDNENAPEVKEDAEHMNDFFNKMLKQDMNRIAQIYQDAFKAGYDRGIKNK